MKMICWACGEQRPYNLKYGYLVCKTCEPTFNPEEAEEIVIETLKQGRLVPLKEIRGEL